MKRGAVILFSLVLVYGGVAWALAKCLGHKSHHRHLIEDRESHAHDATILTDYRDSSWPVIHCPRPEMRIGPAAQSSPTQLNRWDTLITVHAPLFHNPDSLTFRNSSWLDAVFRRMPASLYPNDLDRYLLFSVLQI
jgi:hypothetical protein